MSVFSTSRPNPEAKMNALLETARIRKRNIKALKEEMDTKKSVEELEGAIDNAGKGVVDKHAEEREKRHRLMSILDTINHSSNATDMVHTASFDPEMKLIKKELMSNHYTTRLSDIITIKCNK